MNPNAASFTPVSCAGANTNNNANRAVSPDKENEFPSPNINNNNAAAATPVRPRPTLLRGGATPTPGNIIGRPTAPTTHADDAVINSPTAARPSTNGGSAGAGGGSGARYGHGTTIVANNAFAAAEMMVINTAIAEGQGFNPFGGPINTGPMHMGNATVGRRSPLSTLYTSPSPSPSPTSSVGGTAAAAASASASMSMGGSSMAPPPLVVGNNNNINNSNNSHSGTIMSGPAAAGARGNSQFQRPPPLPQPSQLDAVTPARHRASGFSTTSNTVSPVVGSMGAFPNAMTMAMMQNNSSNNVNSAFASPDRFMMGGGGQHHHQLYQPAIGNMQMHMGVGGGFSNTVTPARSSAHHHHPMVLVGGVTPPPHCPGAAAAGGLSVRVGAVSAAVVTATGRAMSPNRLSSHHMVRRSASPSGSRSAQKSNSPTHNNSAADRFTSPLRVGAAAGAAGMSVVVGATPVPAAHVGASTVKKANKSNANKSNNNGGGNDRFASLRSPQANHHPTAVSLKDALQQADAPDTSAAAATSFAVEATPARQTMPSSSAASHATAGVNGGGKKEGVAASAFATPAAPATPSSSSSGATPSVQRRNEQREKQIAYGYNTAGYRNMLRLIAHDPRLCKGGVIPLPPPSPALLASKRTWDVLIRKWRRALHMFDYVFIDGSEDEAATTREAVLEQQRLKWVSPIHHIVVEEEEPKVTPAAAAATDAHAHHHSEGPTITTGPRLFLSRDLLMAKRFSPAVPKKIPVEEPLRDLLRSPDCYEPVTSVIPESMLYHSKGNTFSAGDVGFKIVIAPSTVSGPYASARSPSPEVPDFAPSQVLAAGGGGGNNSPPASPMRPNTSPLRSSGPSTANLPPPPSAATVAMSPTRMPSSAILAFPATTPSGGASSGAVGGMGKPSSSASAGAGGSSAVKTLPRNYAVGMGMGALGGVGVAVTSPTRNNSPPLTAASAPPSYAAAASSSSPPPSSGLASGSGATTQLNVNASPFTAPSPSSSSATTTSIVNSGNNAGTNANKPAPFRCLVSGASTSANSNIMMGSISSSSGTGGGGASVPLVRVGSSMPMANGATATTCSTSISASRADDLLLGGAHNGCGDGGVLLTTATPCGYDDTVDDELCDADGDDANKKDTSSPSAANCGGVAGGVAPVMTIADAEADTTRQLMADYE